MSDQVEQNKEVEGATSLMLKSITPGILSELPQPSTSVAASFRSLGGGPENPPTCAGVEPATLGTEGQRQTNYATQPAKALNVETL
ncbi:hypothetical protein TNCV_1786011 [Trichonephila clavipes]|nr:hypothetical protein TNCV_1786011 [Trichonephila clavipes]